MATRQENVGIALAVQSPGITSHLSNPTRSQRARELGGTVIRDQSPGAQSWAKLVLIFTLLQSSLFYSETERLNNWPIVIQVVSGRTGIRIQRASF